MKNEVLELLTQKPKRLKFFKRVISFYNEHGQMVETKVFPMLINDWEEVWLVKDLKAAYRDDYKKLGWVGSIVLVLKTRYPDIDMGNDHILQTAQKVEKLYLSRIIALAEKKKQKKVNNGTYVFKPAYSSKEAFKELVARGFIHIATLTNKVDPKTTNYVCNEQWGLIYPKVFEESADAWAFFSKIGVQGYTTLNQKGKR